MQKNSKILNINAKKTLLCFLIVTTLLLTAFTPASAIIVNKDEDSNEIIEFKETEEQETKKTESLNSKEKTFLGQHSTNYLIYQLLKTIYNAFPFLYNITFFANLIESFNETEEDTTPPSKVTGLTLIPFTNMINLSWDAATDDIEIDYYNIYRDDLTTPLYQTSSLEYSDTNVVSSIEYNYSISAVDTSENEGEKSDIITGSPLYVEDNEDPTKVTGLTVTDAFNGKLQLTWDAASDNIGVDFYKIYRDDILLIEINALEYLDSGLTNNQSYSYQISAVDFSGNEGEKSDIVLGIPTENIVDDEPPSKVTGLEVENAFDGELMLSWDTATDNVGIDRYNIYRDSILITETSNLEYLDSGLTNDQSYSYEISAVDTSDNEGEKSDSVSGTPTESHDDATIVPESGHIIISGSGYLQLNTTLDINGTLVTLKGVVFLNSSIRHLHIWWNLTTGFLKINASSESIGEEEDFKLIDFLLEIKESEDILTFYFSFISMYGESCIELNNNAQTGSLSFDGKLKIGSINGSININDLQGITIKGSFYGDSYKEMTGTAYVEWDLTGEKPSFLVDGDLTGSGNKIFSVYDLLFEIENVFYIEAEEIRLFSNGHLTIGEEITIAASLDYLTIKNLYVSVGTDSFSLSGNLDLSASAGITIKTDSTLSELALRLDAAATITVTDFSLNLNYNLIVSCHSLVLSGYGTLLIGDEIIFDASITHCDVSNLHVTFMSKAFILSGTLNLNAAAKVYIKADLGLSNLQIGLFASGTLRISNLYAYVQSLQLTITCKSISISGSGSLSFGSEIAVSAYLNSVNVNSLYFRLGSKALTLSGIITLTGAAALYIRTNLALTKLELYLAGSANLIISNLYVNVNSGAIVASVKKITLSGSGSAAFFSNELSIGANIAQASIDTLIFSANGAKMQINGTFDLAAAGELHVKTDLSSYVELELIGGGTLTLSDLELDMNSGAIVATADTITITAGASVYIILDEEKLEADGSGSLSFTINDLSFDMNQGLHLSVPTLSLSFGASAQEFIYYFSDENDNGGGGDDDDDNRGGDDSDPIIIKGDATLSGTLGLTVDIKGSNSEGDCIGIDLNLKGSGTLTIMNFYYESGDKLIQWTSLNAGASARAFLSLSMPLNIQNVDKINLQADLDTLTVADLEMENIFVAKVSASLIEFTGKVSLNIERESSANKFLVSFSSPDGFTISTESLIINTRSIDLDLDVVNGDFEIYGYTSGDEKHLNWNSENGLTLFELTIDILSIWNIDFRGGGNVIEISPGSFAVVSDLDEDGLFSIDTSQLLTLSIPSVFILVNNWELNLKFIELGLDADNWMLQWDPGYIGGKWYPKNITKTGSISITAGTFIVEIRKVSEEWYTLYPIDAQQVTAHAGGTYTGNIDETIQLDASGSQPEGQLEYRWDYTNNGIYDTDWSTSPYESYVYPEGTHTVKLKVRNKDDILNTDTDTATVIITEAEGYIQGHVYDDQGNPLSNAHVVTDHGYYSTYTDSEGYYEFSVNPDTYILQATKTNYKPEISDSVTVENGETEIVDFYMQESSNLYGYVKDTSGNLIGGAKVQLDNGQYTYTYSLGNMLGHYSFNWELSPGTYDITASKSGYYDTTKYNYEISQGANNLDFVLNQMPDNPVVTTLDATSIASTSANLNGDLESIGGTSSCTVWFVYDTSSHSNWQDYAYSTSTITKTSTGSFYKSISSLQSSTTYHFRAVAQNSQGYDYGSDKYFTTSTCFLAGTKITMEDNTYKNIEEIKTGEKVISYDYVNKKTSIGEVSNTYHHVSEKEMVDRYLVINNVLKVTENHPLFVNDKWLEANEIKIGDSLQSITGEKTIVKSIEKIFEKVPTYNLEIKKYHTYYAEDILVHNKPQPGWVRPTGYIGATGWQNENNAIDTSTSTYSHYYKIGDTGPTDYALTLTYNTLISCNQIKINAENMDQLNYMTVKLYEGSSLKETCFFTTWGDHSYTYDSFTTTQIDKVKITFTLNSGFGYGVYQPRVYDFQVYRT